MYTRTNQLKRFRVCAVMALAFASLCCLSAAAQVGPQIALPLRPGRLPYGAVSSVSSTSAVAQHLSALAHVHGLREQEASKSTPVALPAAIQFAAAQRPATAPQVDSFCNVFLPINPQPLKTSQVVAINPATHTAYMAVFPMLKFQKDGVSVGHMTTCLKVSSDGHVDAKTRVWTGNDFQGFEGGVQVFFSDINGNSLYNTLEHHWGINGHSVPGAPSDRTEIWQDQIPADKVGQLWAVSISQLNSPTSHFDDFMAKAKAVVQLIEEVGKAYQEFKGSPTGAGGTGTDAGGVSGGSGATPERAQISTQPAVNPARVANPAMPCCGSAPCCEITGINAATGVVTAKVKATGQSFQFKVTDAALLHTLKISQGVYANLATRQVSVNGMAPCCVIVR